MYNSFNNQDQWFFKKKMVSSKRWKTSYQSEIVNNNSNDELLGYDISYDRVKYVKTDPFIKHFYKSNAY